MSDNLSSNPLRVRAARNLSQFSITIEITLISVMVGVVIFPLVDFATPLLRELKFEYWPYILCGTLLVIDVWAQVIMHTLSIVSWPLDMVRNALYIYVAIIMAILMHFLADPRGWFVLSVLTALLVFSITWYDLSIIGQRHRLTDSIQSKSLFDAVLKRQRRGIVYSVLYLALSLVATAFAFLAPAFFLEQRGHLLFIVPQLISIAYIVARTISDFNSLSEPILQVAMQDLDLPEPHS